MDDAAPSRWLCGLAAFGGFWLVMTIGLLIAAGIEAEEGKTRDIVVPTAFLVSGFIYWEARRRP